MITAITALLRKKSLLHFLSDIKIEHSIFALPFATVAIFSDADENALFVKMADEAVRIGGKQPNESYLVMDKIIDAAERTGANAIHPGYGFLSERAEFAKRCVEENIIWVGPHPKAIEVMGSKIGAKKIMQSVAAQLSGYLVPKLVQEIPTRPNKTIIEF